MTTMSRQPSSIDSALVWRAIHRGFAVPATIHEFRAARAGTVRPQN
jgi:hypothetical protein